MHLAVSVIESDKGLQSWIKDDTCRRVWLGYSKEDWYNFSPMKGKIYYDYLTLCSSCKKTLLLTMN